MANYKWLDKDGVSYLWGKIKTLVGTKANSADVYTKAEIDSMLGTGVKYAVVDALPTSDIQVGTIYLVPNTKTTGSNVYDEYMYINSKWEVIGTTEANLDNYVEKEEGKGLSSNDFTDDLKTKLEGINLNNYVAKEDGKGLSSNDFTDDLKNKLDGIDLSTIKTGLTSGSDVELAPEFGGSDEKTITITANDGTTAEAKVKITLPEETEVEVPVKGIKVNGVAVDPDEAGIVEITTPEDAVSDVKVKLTADGEATSVVTDGVATINLSGYQPVGNYLTADDFEAITDAELDEICDIPTADPEPAEQSLFSASSNNFLTDGDGNASIDNAGNYPLNDADGTNMEYSINKA